MADAPDSTREEVEAAVEVVEAAEAGAEAAPSTDGDGAVPSGGRPATDAQDGTDAQAAERGEPDSAQRVEPDWKDLAHRKAAELENLRKQTAQRVQKATRDGMRRVASELLPALDDFERALAHAEAEEGDSEHHLTNGIRLVQEQMLAALRRAGIESYSPQGEPFDPRLHEAVATAAADDAESGTVVEVYQAGYRFGDDVLRPAKVVVAA